MFYHNTNFKGGSVFRGRVTDDKVIEGEIEKEKIYTEAEMNCVIEIQDREKYRVEQWSICEHYYVGSDCRSAAVAVFMFGIMGAAFTSESIGA